MRIGVIVQARLGSSRLPQKITLPFYQGKGVLELLIERLNNILTDIPIVVATTENTADDILVDLCESKKIQYFRGNENNVLDRFIAASTQFNLEKVVRVCSDNPFLDENTLNVLVNGLRQSEVDYWCYAKSDNTPAIKTHWGFWCEGVSLRALKEVSRRTKEPLYLEHVTNFIYTFPKTFKIHYQHIPIEVERRGNIRLTLDTKEDFAILSEIYKDIIERRIPFDSVRIVKHIMNNMAWVDAMNRNINSNPK